MALYDSTGDVEHMIHYQTELCSPVPPVKPSAAFRPRLDKCIINALRLDRDSYEYRGRMVRPYLING